MLTREFCERKFDFFDDLNRTEFEYDADNKMVYSEKYKDDAILLKARYTYDGLGRRIEKEVTKGSVVTRKSYIYNGDDILLEYNTTGATPIETAKYIGTGSIDDNLMTIRSGKAFFYHKDHLGSVGAITNDGGEVIQKNQYSSFGKILSIKDKNRKEVGIEGAIEKSFSYTGREWDEEIDLYYYRARHYDPHVGRFVQMDPIGLAAGDANLYRYVQNSPLNFVDPLGLTQEDIDLAMKYVRARYPEAKNVPYRVAYPGELDSTTAGKYSNGEVIFSRDYLKALKSVQAADLLDTAFHEVGHYQNPLKMVGDVLLPGQAKNDFFHRQVYDQAILDTADSIVPFLKERKTLEPYCK